MILKHFSAVDTQTAVLVPTAEDQVWISALDTQTPISLVFLGNNTADFGFSAGRQNFGKFAEVPVTKIRA